MTFTKNDTLVAKGVAVIFLLIHHLFYTTNYNFDAFIISKDRWVDIAKIGKICVAMFLILSGYGLSISWKNKKYTLIHFYKHIYIKLYKGFLPISLLSLTPIFFHCSGLSFSSIWGNSRGG